MHLYSEYNMCPRTETSDMQEVIYQNLKIASKYLSYV